MNKQINAKEKEHSLKYHHSLPQIILQSESSKGSLALAQRTEKETNRTE